MELFVNGSKLDVQLEDEKTVGDVLKAFEEECQKINTTTVAIQINGKNISAELFEEAAKEELKDDTIIELKTISQAAIEASFEEERKFCLKLADELKSAIGKEVQINYGHDGGYIPWNSCGRYHIKSFKIVEGE